MTNIWTQAFEDIRKPHFEMEDPYTKIEEEKAKKDYDGDGKVESGAKEYRGVIHNAIQKKKGLKPDGKDTSSVKEEVEEKDPFGRPGGKYGGVPKKGSGYDRAWKAIQKKNAELDKKTQKEEVENLVEVDKTQQSQKKIDVMKGKNKVIVGPQLAQNVTEEVEAWVGELVEEGYDLSQFTLDEIVDIYESAELEEGTAGMPARGDAENVSIDTQSKKLARARIQKDMADVKYNRAVTASESFDSILEYLSQRPDAFENLEEGVFDPKKSKLRPASERSKTAMTSAQRTAQKKAAARTAEIHSKGETVLAGMRPSKKGKVQTKPEPKSAAPAANRTVKGRYDKLAKAASAVLKDVQSK